MRDAVGSHGHEAETLVEGGGFGWAVGVEVVEPVHGAIDDGVDEGTGDADAAVGGGDVEVADAAGARVGIEGVAVAAADADQFVAEESTEDDFARTVEEIGAVMPVLGEAVEHAVAFGGTLGADAVEARRVWCDAAERGLLALCPSDPRRAHLANRLRC